MTAELGTWLRAQREERGWSRSHLARLLITAAKDAGDNAVPAVDTQRKNIYRWENDEVDISDRYRLLYCRVLDIKPAQFGPQPEPGIAANQTAAVLPPATRMSSWDLVAYRAIEATEGGQSALASALTELGVASEQEPPGDIATLTASADAVRRQYQACSYVRAAECLPRLIRQLNAACAILDGNARDRAHALSADAHHVAASLMLKHGDLGLASLAADRSMRAAQASGDPVAIASSARIVTHALMNGGHLETAVSTAASHASRLGRDMPNPDPGTLSVYGALLLRGAVAAACDDNRGRAYELLAEAEDAARRLGRDANHRWTAFGPVNATLHRINIAVTLGDAGTAIDLARGVSINAITLTERKATLFIDTARAFMQRDRHENAYLAMRAAYEAAPEEVSGRASIRALVRALAATAPTTVRRDAAEFAASIGAAQ